jgi:hypothetical protein
MALGWNPWRELRRRPHLLLRWGHLGSMGGRIDDLPNGMRQITLDIDLDRVHRNAVLAHELIHDERGLPPWGTPFDLRTREERAVREETVRRLVPVDLLADFVNLQVADHGCCEWREVAEHFEVPRDIAEMAMIDLARRRRCDVDSMPPLWT